MLKFYWYPRCSTCIKARKVLDAAGIKYKEIDITQTPPSQADFKRWLKSGQVELAQFFNTSGQEYRKPEIKAELAKASDLQKIKLLAGNGRLVKRPIIADATRVTVGFRDIDAIMAIWS